MFDKEALTRKLGPLPVWAWGVLLGAVVVGFMIWQNNAIGNAESGTAAVDATNDADPEVSGTQLTPAGTTVGDTGDVESSYASNLLWESAVIAYLSPKGYSPLKIQVALEKYFNGKTLTAADQKIVNAAVAYAGLPPDGVESAVKLETPTGPAGALVIKKPIGKRPTDAPKALGTGMAKPQAATKSRSYTVKRGDTLSAIAKKFYGHSTPAIWQKIASANGLANANVIRPGQKLTIPA